MSSDKPTVASMSPNELEEEIKRVRTREEARLIAAANRAGYFNQAIKTADINEMFEQTLATMTPKHSQLRKLEDRMTKLNSRMRDAARRLDAQRKILLGAFLIAQMNHRPEDFEWVAGELEKFLSQHKDAKVAARNKEIMADWLDRNDDPETNDADMEPPHDT
ncbi:hypothetical protein [uncultured Tateyamaria sp.]|uniref:hypothetical protein n=1 Tax=uncultured Tateyamaria sp. TaxID=455651 RepID=UPI002635FB47|nr:hypothetical protein [uncultured Tateyamaria sp.]